jgi:hypothetical protein
MRQPPSSDLISADKQLLKSYWYFNNQIGNKFRRAISCQLQCTLHARINRSKWVALITTT